jgi:hypothetical protein
MIQTNVERAARSDLDDGIWSPRGTLSLTRMTSEELEYEVKRSPVRLNLPYCPFPAKRF